MQVYWAPFLALLSASALAYSAPFVAFIPNESHSDLIRPLNFIEEPEVDVNSDNVVRRLLRGNGSSKEICSLDSIFVASVNGLDRDAFTQMNTGKGTLHRHLFSTNKVLVYTNVDHSESIPGKLKSALNKHCHKDTKLVHKHYSSLQDGNRAISGEIDHLKSSSLDTLILLHGVDNKSHVKRDVPLKQGNGTNTNGVFDRYVFFSPMSVLTLGISAFLIFFTLNALWIIGTTETPDRLGQLSRAARDKKQQ